MAGEVITPLHKWTAGRGASVLLTEPDEAAVELHQRPGVPLLFLTELWVPLNQRGKGCAGALLTAATAWADSDRVDLWLYIAPHGPKPRLSLGALRELYTKYGFRPVQRSNVEEEMLRLHNGP